jgi:hypothetical protein
LVVVSGTLPNEAALGVAASDGEIANPSRAYLTVLFVTLLVTTRGAGALVVTIASVLSNQVDARAAILAARSGLFCRTSRE